MNEIACPNAECTKVWRCIDLSEKICLKRDKPFKPERLNQRLKALPDAAVPAMANEDSVSTEAGTPDEATSKEKTDK